jgi:hypothetical protein
MLRAVAPPRELTIQPLAVGGVIDRAIAVTRRHFGALFLAMLALQVPATLLFRLVSGRAAELLEVAGDPAALGSRAPGLVTLLASVLAALSLLQFVGTATAAILVSPSLAGPPAPGAPTLARRALATLTGGLLQLLVLALAPALGALPGLVVALRGNGQTAVVVGLGAALLGAVLAFLAALLRTILAPAVTGIEGRGGLGALRRSSRLMAPRAGQPALERPGLRASLLLLTTFLLALAVNALAGLPRLLAVRLAGGDASALLGGGLPAPLEIALSLAEAVAGAALQPFSLTALAVFYFERRARTEGLDLELWASRLEVAR